MIPESQETLSKCQTFFFFPSECIYGKSCQGFIFWMKKSVKKCKALITTFSFSIQSSTTGKYPEIIGTLYKNDGRKVSEFQNPYCKLSLYTQRVYNNIIGIAEEWDCSSRTKKRSSASQFDGASKGKQYKEAKKNQTINKSIKYKNNF